jgi:hypothetical protein
MAPRPETARPLVPGPGIDPEQHLAALGIEVLHLAVLDTSGTLRQKRFRLPRAAGLIREAVPDGPGGLPRTLLEAAERFAASKLAGDLVGEAFARHYAATRIEEDQQTRRHVPATGRARYLDHV